MRINAANKTGFLALILCLAAALAVPPQAFSHLLEKFEQKKNLKYFYFYYEVILLIWCGCVCVLNAINSVVFRI